MGYVSMKELQEQIDLHEVETAARATWERDQRKRQLVEWVILKSLPIGVLIMAAIFYVLSAPHTAAILNVITPGWGQFAPLGFELGILVIAAFRERGWKTSLSAGILYTLLAMAILINIAGGMIAVIEFASQGTTQAIIADGTLLEILGQWQMLPARYQLVIMLVFPLGVVIPFIAKLVGEILIRIAFGKMRLNQESPEERWARDSYKVMHGSLLQAALKLGAGVKTAGNWAKSVCDQMYQYKPVDINQRPTKAIGNGSVEIDSQPARVMGFHSSQTVPGQSNAHFLSGENQDSVESQVIKDINDSLPPRLSKKNVTEWLSQRPEYHQRSDRDVSRAYMLDTFGIDSESGYKTVQRAKKDLGL